MTDREKVLAVWPNAECVRDWLSGREYAIYFFGASPDAPIASGWCETEEAAWQNAAESLPAQPEQEPEKLAGHDPKKPWTWYPPCEWCGTFIHWHKREWVHVSEYGAAVSKRCADGNHDAKPKPVAPVEADRWELFSPHPSGIAHGCPYDYSNPETNRILREERERDMQSPSLGGTFNCPICGNAHPHEHTGEEIAEFRGARLVAEPKPTPSTPAEPVSNPYKLPWEAMAGSIIDTVHMTPEDYVNENLVEQLKRYFLPQPASISSEPMPKQLVSDEMVSYLTGDDVRSVADMARELQQWRKWAAAKGSTDTEGRCNCRPTCSCSVSPVPHCHYCKSGMGE